jgi:hypothetical protein
MASGGAALTIFATLTNKKPVQMVEYLVPNSGRMQVQHSVLVAMDECFSVALQLSYRR